MTDKLTEMNALAPANCRLPELSIAPRGRNPFPVKAT